MSPAAVPITRAEMSVVAMRLGAARPTVEALLAHIDDLARQRQELRGSRAPARALERNRRALVRSQWELSHALIARHLQPAHRAA